MGKRPEIHDSSAPLRSRRIGLSFPKDRCSRSRSVVGPFPKDRTAFPECRCCPHIGKCAAPFESIPTGRPAKSFKPAPPCPAMGQARANRSTTADTSGTLRRCQGGGEAVRRSMFRRPSRTPRANDHPRDASGNHRTRLPTPPPREGAIKDAGRRHPGNAAAVAARRYRNSWRCWASNRRT